MVLGMWNLSGHLKDQLKYFRKHTFFSFLCKLTHFYEHVRHTCVLLRDQSQYFSLVSAGKGVCAAYQP